MSDLVFTTGGFSSGSTLLFTVFRKAGEFYCLYEPLHERLMEHRYGNLRAYEHHYFVEEYFSEYRGFTELTHLHAAMAGTNLFLPATAPAPDLYRYLSYLIGMSFGRNPKVLLKENRLTFRLGWIRAQFPVAKVVHVYRDCDAQWKSTVRRAQAFYGTKDVGQENVGIQRHGHRRYLRRPRPGLPGTRRRPLEDRLRAFREALGTEPRRERAIRARHRALRGPDPRFRGRRPRDMGRVLGCTR